MESEIASAIAKAAAGLAPAEYCVLWIPHWSTCMAKTEWAAWAQAVFSVLAIYVALSVANRQRRAEMKREAQVHNARAFVVKTAVALVVVETRHIAEEMSKRWGDAIRLGFAPGSIESLKREVVALEFPTEDKLLLLAHSWPVASQHLVLAQSYWTYLVKMLDKRLTDNYQVTPKDFAALKLQLSDVVRSLDRGACELGSQGYMVALQSDPDSEGKR